MATCLECGKPFRAARSSKKYCSTACKQNAYLKRLAGADDANDDNVTVIRGDFTVNDDKGSVKERYLPVLYRKPASPAGKDDNSYRKTSSGLIANRASEEAPYRWVIPDLFTKLQEEIDRRNYQYFFDPMLRDENTDKIEWVNTIWKSILQRLLTLSYKEYLEYNDVKAIYRATCQLIDSEQMKQLGEEHPYYHQIHELASKWRKALQKGRGAGFTVSESSMFKILLMLSEIGITVPDRDFRGLFK